MEPTPPPEPAGNPPGPLTAKGYLIQVREALIQGRPIPELPSDIVASMSPTERSALQHTINQLCEATGRPAPRIDAARSAWPVIPGYPVIGELGAGAQGEVYLARDVEESGRWFAIKVLKEFEGVLAGEWRRRGEAEIDILRRLNDIDGVVNIVGHGLSLDGRPFIAMDYVAGASLWRRIRANQEWEGRPQPIRASARLVLRLARIVQEVHDRGVLHRDLKPSNVLLSGPDARELRSVLPDLSDDETPVIADFGLARALRMSQDRSIAPPDRPIGTPSYMAPEQWDAQRDRLVGPWTDVWGLGVILYQLVTGELPFPKPRDESDRPACTLPPVWPHRLLPDIPRDLEAVIIKCLNKTPGDRYPTARALADELDRFLHPGGRVEAPRVGLAMKARAAIQRNRGLANAGLVVLIASVPLGYAVISTSNANALRAHEASVAEARAQARRGDWPRSLGSFGRAIAQGYPDATALRVERLPGYLAVNDLATMEREVDGLYAGYIPPHLVAPLELARGTRLMCDRKTRDPGRDAVRKALAKPGDLLAMSPANVAYAQSLLEDTPGGALARLRDAVGRDPFHVPSQAALIVALMVDGRLGDARAEAERLRGILPDSHLSALVLILADLCDGDRASADRRVGEIAARLGAPGKSDVARLREWIDQLAPLIDALSRQDPNRLAPLDKLTIQAKSLKLRSLAARPLPLDVPVPLIGLLDDAIEPLVRASGTGWAGRLLPAPESGSLSVGTMIRAITSLSGVIGNNALLDGDEGYRLLLDASKHCGDGLLASLIAMNRMRACSRLTGEGDEVGFKKLLPEAARWSERGAIHPTLLPRSPERYKSLVVWAVVDVSQMKLVKDVDPRVRDRLRENSTRLIFEGRKHPTHRTEALPMLINMVTVPLVPSQMADWPGGEGNPDYQERCRWLRNYARRLVDDWIDDAPNDKQAREWLNKIEAGPVPPAAKP